MDLLRRVLVFLYACNKGTDKGETADVSSDDNQAGQVEQGEHAGESEHSGEGEEAGPRLAKDGKHGEIRKGVRLILSFDDESSFFIGTVENVTEEAVSRVCVEVHLSNGKELGPTKHIDLEPGKKRM